MSKAILCVDDSATMRHVVRIALARGGYEVTEAVDGADALRKAGERSFDLVLTDLNMPNLDGLGLARGLRALPAYAKVPIVFLTTESQADKKREAQEAGATAWIAKPFQPERLLALVNRVLE